MPAGVLGFRAQRPHSSIQQDELGRERTNVAVVGFEGVLGRIQHQSDNQRRHHDKEVGHEPDHTACIVLQVLGGQPRLAEEPKKGCAHHGQEGEYGHDKFGHFFPPSMSLKFATVLPVSIGTTVPAASGDDQEKKRRPAEETVPWLPVCFPAISPSSNTTPPRRTHSRSSSCATSRQAPSSISPTMGGSPPADSGRAKVRSPTRHPVRSPPARSSR